MSSRAAVTAREERPAMPDDGDFASRGSTPDDLAQRDDLADAAEAADEADLLETDDTDVGADDSEPAEREGARSGWGRLAVTMLPALVMILALGIGYLKWLDGKERESLSAARQSVQAASESTIAILSYKPESVDEDLKSAADRLTSGFRQQYIQLVTDVVAPGAKQQHITAVATVPAAASVSATGKQAVVLVFVDQTTTVGNDPPTQSTSSVRVTLDKVDGRWLISQFDPV